MFPSGVCFTHAAVKYCKSLVTIGFLICFDILSAEIFSLGFSLNLSLSVPSSWSTVYSCCSCDPLEMLIAGK